MRLGIAPRSVAMHNKGKTVRVRARWSWTGFSATLAAAVCGATAPGRDLEKLLKSAVASAQAKDHDLDIDRLIVSRATVDDAPPAKRIRHQAMGRVYQILKRACHVTFALDVPQRRGRAG